MAENNLEPGARNGPFSEFRPPMLHDRSLLTESRELPLSESVETPAFRPPSTSSSFTSDTATTSVGSHDTSTSMVENRSAVTQFRDILPNGIPLEDIRPETWQYLSHPYNEQPAQHQRQESRESYASSASEETQQSQSADPQLLPSIKELICPHCSRVFLDNRTLRAHVRTHIQGRPYTCDICGATFSRLHDLERHTMIHTGEKPHVCNICGRKFARAYTMSRHQNGAKGCAGRRTEKRSQRSRHSASPITRRSPGASSTRDTPQRELESQGTFAETNPIIQEASETNA